MARRSSAVSWRPSSRGNPMRSSRSGRGKVRSPCRCCNRSATCASHHRHRRFRRRIRLVHLPDQTADRLLKIDRAFVIEMDIPEWLALVSAIVILGARAEAAGGGGRRRNRCASASATLAQLRRNAGLFIQQPGAGRDVRRKIPGSVSRRVTNHGKENDCR